MNKKIVYTNTRFLAAYFFALVGMMLLGIFVLKLKNYQSKLESSVQTWQTDLAEMVTKEDFVSLLRMSKNILSENSYSFVIQLDESTAVSYPEGAFKHDCLGKSTTVVSRYGVNLARIAACPNLSLVWKEIFGSTPIFLLVFVFSLWVVSFTLIPFFQYKRDLIEWLNFSKKWSNDSLQKDNWSLAYRPKLTDPIAEEIFELVSDGVAKRIQLAALEDKLLYERKISLIAKQVAHDIRSPLSALNAISYKLSHVDSEASELLNHSVDRINGIASEILDLVRNKEIKITTTDKNSLQNRETIYFLVNSLVKEKANQYENFKFSLSADLESINSETLFEIESNKLSRILSNLVNNSIEASKMTKVKNIDIQLHLIANCLVISVSDGGVGIPDEIISNIGVEGFTFGKNPSDNYGLGIFSAIDYLNTVGAFLKISSRVNIGTTVQIHLPIKYQT